MKRAVLTFHKKYKTLKTNGVKRYWLYETTLFDYIFSVLKVSSNHSCCLLIEGVFFGLIVQGEEWHFV